MSAAGQIRDLVSAALDEFLQALRGRDDEQQKQIDDLTKRVEALEGKPVPKAAPAKKTAATKAQAGTAEVKGKAPGATTA